MIPVVGPILAAIPASRWPRRCRSKKVLFVLIFFFLQQQLENHILVPKIMSRQVGVSAVTVIVALLIGGELAGHRRRDPRGADRRHPPGRRVRADARSGVSGGRGRRTASVPVEQDANPRNDGSGDIQRCQHGDDAMHRGQVQRDPERSGRRSWRPPRRRPGPSVAMSQPSSGLPSIRTP